MSFFYSKQIEQLKGTIAQLEQSNAEHETVVAGLKQEHETAINALRQTHETAIAQLKQEHEAKVTQLEKAHKEGFEQAVQKAVVEQTAKLGVAPIQQDPAGDPGSKPVCTAAQYKAMTDKQRDDHRAKGGIVDG